MTSFHLFVRSIVNIFLTIKAGILSIFSTYLIKWVEKMFLRSGIEVNGENPWDIQVEEKHKIEVYSRFSASCILGLGEAYMEGKLKIRDLEEFCFRFLRSKDLEANFLTKFNFITMYLAEKLFNQQTKELSMEVAEKHYDGENEVIMSTIGSTLNYTCAYWKNAKNVDEAQIAKMELIAQKLKLKPGMKVLDLGCGWGPLCKYLAEKYSVSVVGVNIAKEGCRIAREICKNLPVEIREMDYREIINSGEVFDRVVTIGMIEHVGYSNYRNYFETVHKVLKDGGIFLLHTIAIGDDNLPQVEPFTNKYIFQNSMLPYASQLIKNSSDLFTMEDWQNMSYHYSLTLKAWFQNFVKDWPKLSQNRDEKFYRMWEFYLKFASAFFRSRRGQLYQIVFSKDGLLGGYDSPR